MPGRPLTRARALEAQRAAAEGRGHWDWQAREWRGPISPGTLATVAAMRAGGATWGDIERATGLPYPAVRWICVRPDVVAMVERTHALRYRASRVNAMRVLDEVASDDGVSPGDRTRAASAILQHAPATDEPADVGDDQLAEWLVGERDSGRLAALLARGDELIAARAAATEGKP